MAPRHLRLSLAWLLSLAALAAQDSPWPMFQGNPQHTGRSAYTGPRVNQIRCSYHPAEEGIGTPAIAPDGTIYIPFGMPVTETSGNGSLTAFQPDCTVKWSAPLNGLPGVTAPAIGPDGTIYVHTIRLEPDRNHTYTLHAINPDGSTKWRHQFPRNGSTTYILPSAVIAPDATIWIESLDFNLYALRPDGTVKCSARTTVAELTTPALAPDGTVYVAGFFGLYAYTPACQLKWQFPFPESTGVAQAGSPAVGDDGTIYVPGPSTTRQLADLYAIAPDGKLKWQFTGGDHAYSSPAIAADGTIYFGNDRLYALTPAGLLKWARSCPGVGSTASPIVDAAGTIFWQLNNSACAVTAGGHLQWTLQTGSSYVPASPVIAPDGRLYLGSGGFYEPPLLQVLSDSPPPVALTYPSNGAVQVPPSAVLTWTATAGATSYDVYFGAANPPPPVSNVTTPGFSPALAYNAAYYWKIVARNGRQSLHSPVWSFTTQLAPPAAPSLASPPNGITVATASPLLFWSAAAGAAEYALYFGNSANPPLAAILHTTNYAPGPLNGATRYYWRVEARNATGARSSATYSFTTPSATPGPDPVSRASLFVAISPCRLADTRIRFRGQPLPANTSQTIGIATSPCGIPNTATAYVLNITAVPHGPLPYLTVWPAGQPRPLVSTLNSSDGRIQANMAIVPSGTNGSIDLYAAGATDVVIDINGYYTAR